MFRTKQFDVCLMQCSEHDKGFTYPKTSPGAVKFRIIYSTNIRTVSLKTLLSHTKTKAQLTGYLGSALLQAFQASQKKLVIWKCAWAIW